MSECRRLLCGEPATVQASVTHPSGNVSDVAYCDQHFETVRRVVETYEKASIHNIQRIEKGTTVTNDLTSAKFAREIERLTAMIRESGTEINNLKEDRDLAKQQLTDAAETINNLVKDLHAYIEQTCDEDIIEAVNELLRNRDLPTSRANYELIFTVPVQIRVEGTYRNKEDMRAEFVAGNLTWDVADYEETMEDDIKIVEIAEVQR